MTELGEHYAELGQQLDNEDKVEQPSHTKIGLRGRGLTLGPDVAGEQGQFDQLRKVAGGQSTSIADEGFLKRLFGR